MILIAFALLLPEPVHEEPVRQVHHRNGSQHDNGQAGSRKPSEKPSEKPQAAKRLANDDEKGNDPWESHFLREGAHGAVKAEAAEPSQQLLGAVREHDKPEGDPQDESRQSVVGLKQRLHAYLLVGASVPAR